MTPKMTPADLSMMVERVFRPSIEDTGVILLVDLPDKESSDNMQWRTRRRLASDWMRGLRSTEASMGLSVEACLYQSVGANNSDLPEACWLLDGDQVPDIIECLDPDSVLSFDEVFRRNSIFMALTEYSATAPLKLASQKYGFRAATMGGFSAAMIPALKLDYGEVNRRVNLLKDLLDRSKGAVIVFLAGDAEICELYLDLRFRTAHASGGLLREPGMAGNLPSGESYIVPYEGEHEGEESLSTGRIPVQFGQEVVFYEVIANRAVRVTGQGEAARSEAEFLQREPAYGNIAELGLGVLDDFGVKPCGSVLLDEKLGLHIAFGRSDHFGGQVGAKDFLSQEAVVHIDRVYVPSVQPLIKVKSILLEFEGHKLELMKDGVYSIDFGQP